MSFGSPCGAPASTHLTMVSSCSSLSERSFLNFWMPTVRSICHGGIWPSATRALIERAHGRASAKVISDIGAIESGRWQASHLSWKIGAMSLVNVGVFGVSAAPAAAGSISATPSVHAPTATILVLNLMLIPSPSILRSNGHFDVGIGPAALKAGAAFSRLVVGLDAKRVIAGRVEGRVGGNPLVLRAGGNARLVECYVAPPAKILQRDGRALGHRPAERRRPRYLHLVRRLGILDPDADLDRLLHGPRERRRRGHRRSGEFRARLRKCEHRRLVVHPELLERADRIALVQGQRNRIALAIGDDGPGDRFGPEILRHLDHEHAPLPSDLEVRRLTLIRRARLDAVVRTDRDVERFLLIAVVVAEQHAEAAVLVLVPAFVGRRDARPALALRF